jgi:multiple sugar transport system permease protein
VKRLILRFKDLPAITLVAILLLFIYVPFVWTVSTSFKGPQEWAVRPPTLIPSNPTLANYMVQFMPLPREVYGSWYEAYGSAVPFILNSLIVSGMTVLAVAFLSITITYLSKTSSLVDRLSPTLVFIDAIPKITVAVGFLWLFTVLRGLYDSYQGLSFAYIAETIGLSLVALRLFYDRIPMDIEQSMMLNGYGRFRAYLSNLLGNCRTGLALMLFLTFILSWQDFTYALILTNFRSTTTVRLASFTHEVGELFGPRAALAILIALPSLVLTTLLWSRLREYYPAVQLYEYTVRQKFSRRGWAHILMDGLFLILYGLLLVVPFAMTAFYWVLAPSPTPLVDRLVAQLLKYWDAVTRSAYYLALSRTWAISGLTLLATSAAGLLVAYLTVFRGERWGRYIFPLMMIPLFIPPIVSGYTFRILFYPSGPVESFISGIGLRTTSLLADPMGAFLGVTAANIWSSTPFAVLIMYSGGRTVNQELWMSSIVMGAGRLRTFFTVVVPQISKYLLLVALLVGIHTFEIFDIPYIMTFGGPGTATETASFYIYTNGLRAGDLPFASALSVITGLIQIIFTLTLLRLIRKAG